jgi:hypothetical protein
VSARLFPALTARERAVLVRRTARAGEATEELVRNVPPDQRLEYNRYMALVFVAEYYFANVIHLVTRQLEAFDFASTRMRLLEEAATLLEEDYPDSIATEPVRAWDKMQRAKNKLITTPTFLRSLAQEIREDLHKELCFRWQELRGIEIGLRWAQCWTARTSSSRRTVPNWRRRCKRQTT